MFAGNHAGNHEVTAAHTISRKQHMPNWFIAIPVAPTGWFEPPVRTPPKGFRSTHPDDLHVTVAFLGPVQETRARAAWEALRWNVGPRSISLGKPITLGPPINYSALVITLADRALEQAIARCRDAVCSAAGVLADRRPPLPHVTIARPPKLATAADREAGLTWASQLELHTHQTTLDTLALYARATDPRDGRKYRTVCVQSFAQLIGEPQR